jgi:hypothetical protein
MENSYNKGNLSLTVPSAFAMIFQRENAAALRIKNSERNKEDGGKVGRLEDWEAAFPHPSILPPFHSSTLSILNFLGER